MGTHEIADWALTHDGRDTRLFVAVGLRAGASAVTGEAWAMAACAGGAQRTGRGRCPTSMSTVRWRGPTGR